MARASRTAGFALALGSSLACLVLAELAVRGLGLAPQLALIELDTRHGNFVSSDDPELRYEPAPGVAGINAYGLRDYDYSLEKPAGTQRIIVLGDSIGFGYCTWNETLRLAATFDNVLERRLREQPITRGAVEVINLSVSGYSTVQEVVYLQRKGLALQPDLVVVAYCMNDDVTFGESGELKLLSRDPRFADSNALARALRRNLLLRSHLVRALWFNLGLLGASEEHIRSGAGDYAARLDRDFERLRVLGAAHGFRTLVVLFPHLHHQAAGVYEDAARHLIVAAVARSKGFETVDLLPIFLAASQGDLTRIAGRCHALHPDEAGHGIAAAAVFDHLASTELLR